MFNLRLIIISSHANLMLNADATVEVVVNGTKVVAGGQTTATGHFLLEANVSTEATLTSLLSNDGSVQVVLTNPPPACGAFAAAATKLSAPVTVNGFGGSR